MLLMLVVTAVLLQTVACITIAELYPSPLGGLPVVVDEGCIPTTDDGSFGPISFAARIFGTLYNNVYVGTNGYVSFGTSFTSFAPKTFPSDETPPLVSPYYSDINTNVNGQICVGLAINTAIRTVADDQVAANFALVTPFTSVAVLIVTYIEVSGYGGDSSTVNTFQVAIATDGSSAYAIFSYVRLDWAPSAGASTGINAGDGINSVIINGSSTSAVLDHVTNTNIGIPGQFILGLDGSVPSDGGDDTTTRTGTTHTHTRTTRTHTRTRTRTRTGTRGDTRTGPGTRDDTGRRTRRRSRRRRGRQ